ncbi:MAG: hypothetical protein KDD70_09565, partial [Bdellovibrionales bacterium]|nr:hypothetical protein [Bdellovibrionales bacterium]
VPGRQPPPRAEDAANAEGLLIATAKANVMKKLLLMPMLLKKFKPFHQLSNERWKQGNIAALFLLNCNGIDGFAATCRISKGEDC